MRARFFALIVLGWLGVPADAHAHPGSHQELERLSVALEKDQGSVDLLVERAHSHRHNEDFRAALADLDRARALAPDRREITLQRGLNLAALKRDAEAEREFSRFLAHEPDSAAALAGRAAVRARLGRRSEAIADYDAVLRLGDSVELYIARGRLQEESGLLDAAAAGYRRGLHLSHGAVTLRTALIRVETKRGRFDDALSLIEVALARSPVKTEWYLRQAEVLSAAGRAAEADESRERALAEAESALARRASAMALYNRARVHAARGDHEAASRDLLSALNRSPRYEQARSMLQRIRTDLPTKETR